MIRIQVTPIIIINKIIKSKARKNDNIYIYTSSKEDDNAFL